MKQRLGRDQRIKKKREFQLLFDKGKPARGKFFTLWIFENPVEKTLPRCAVMVSKRVDTRAAVRNLWKRRSREAFRRNQQLFKSGISVLFKVRAGIKLSGKAASYIEIEQELKALLGKSGFLK